MNPGESQLTWTPRMLLQGDLGCIRSACADLRVRDKGGLLVHPQSSQFRERFGSNGSYESIFKVVVNRVLAL